MLGGPPNFGFYAFTIGFEEYRGIGLPNNLNCGIVVLLMHWHQVCATEAAELAAGDRTSSLCVLQMVYAQLVPAFQNGELLESSPNTLNAS